ALAAVEYYRYSADTEFADYALPALRHQLGYLSQHIDDNGLLVTTANGFEGMDWAFDNGPSVGEVSYFNMLYYHLLTEMNYLESHVGSTAQAAEDLRLAAALKARINDKLYSPSLKSYVYTDAKSNVIPQDADVASVLWGIAPTDEIATILNTVKTELWRDHGTAPWSDNAGFRDVMSPYITGFEVDARFATGDSADAMTLLDRMWGYMLRSPLFTGTFWEELQYDGSLWNGAHDSLAHGWSSGPTYQATQYILGVQPVEPGYRTWTVAPRPSGLRWAKGTVPTPYGPITVSWRSSRSGFDLTVHAPAGTSGTITIPGTGSSEAVTVSGGSTRTIAVARH
ncbi:MAG TPA: alpha-L-rhamnosidase C-terminal domain-containing protein, partial [Jatrophihabitans sp.]|nr:alpha-L-rhamnosidase C-terminal domain-containing protein [Jatrophihabitans sp.]